MDKNAAIERLSALAQETRLDVFRLLVEAGSSGAPAGVIGERLGVPAPTLSFHLKELRRAGVVEAERRGRSIVYRADFTAMRTLVDYLLADCCRGLATARAACREELGAVPAGRRRAAGR